MTTVYTGYSSQLWQAVIAGLNLYQLQLAQSVAGATSSGTTSGSTLTSAPISNAQIALESEAMFETLQNGAEAINVQSLAQAWQTETGNLQAINILGLTLDPVTQAFFTNRLTAFETATAALLALVVNPPYQPASVILNGNPIIPYSGLLEFFGNFDYETPPEFSNLSTFIAAIAAETQAWATVAAAILAAQGSQVNQLYDAAIRQMECSAFAQYIVNELPLQQFIFGGSSEEIPLETQGGSPITTQGGLNLLIEGGPPILWNQLVALPAMAACGEIISGAPWSSVNQQNMVLKNAMLSIAAQVATLITVLDRPVAKQQVASTILRNNETLQDVAARTTGNSDDWVEIAALNGLIPPYVGSIGSPGVAPWGALLLLPTPGLRPSAVGGMPNYSRDFLGVDLYFGPINGVFPWTGEFQTIAGYPNLLMALGRRIQTTQGTLVYHVNYGSRIPPEVGNVQTNKTAGHIASYGINALKSDPRVSKVQKASAVLLNNGLINFSATVQPGGFNNTPVSLNEVI